MRQWLSENHETLLWHGRTKLEFGEHLAEKYLTN